MATKDFTTNQSGAAFQAEKPMWKAYRFDMSGNLPNGSAAAAADGDTVRLIKLEPYSRVTSFQFEVCTTETCALCLTFGIAGSCLSDADGLDVVNGNGAAKTITFGVAGTDAAIGKSTGQCGAYITMYTCGISCTLVGKIGATIVRDKDHV